MSVFNIWHFARTLIGKSTRRIDASPIPYGEKLGDSLMSNFDEQESELLPKPEKPSRDTIPVSGNPKLGTTFNRLESQAQCCNVISGVRCERFRLLSLGLFCSQCTTDISRIAAQIPKISDQCLARGGTPRCRCTRKREPNSPYCCRCTDKHKYEPFETPEYCDSPYCTVCAETIIKKYAKKYGSTVPIFSPLINRNCIGIPCKSRCCNRKIGEPNGKAGYNPVYCEQCTEGIIRLQGTGPLVFTSQEDQKTCKSPENSNLSGKENQNPDSLCWHRTPTRICTSKREPNSPYCKQCTEDIIENYYAEWSAGKMMIGASNRPVQKLYFCEANIKSFVGSTCLNQNCTTINFIREKIRKPNGKPGYNSAYCEYCTECIIRQEQVKRQGFAEISGKENPIEYPQNVRTLLAKYHSQQRISNSGRRCFDTNRLLLFSPDNIKVGIPCLNQSYTDDTNHTNSSGLKKCYCHIGEPNGKPEYNSAYCGKCTKEILQIFQPKEGTQIIVDGFMCCRCTAKREPNSQYCKLCAVGELANNLSGKENQSESLCKGKSQHHIDDPQCKGMWRACSSKREPDSLYCKQCIRHIIRRYAQTYAQTRELFFILNVKAGIPCESPCDRKIGEPNGKPGYNSVYCEQCTKSIINAHKKEEEKPLKFAAQIPKISEKENQSSLCYRRRICRTSGAQTEPDSPYCKDCIRDIIITYARENRSIVLFDKQNMERYVGSRCSESLCTREIGKPNGKAEHNNVYCARCTENIINNERTRIVQGERKKETKEEQFQVGYAKSSTPCDECGKPSLDLRTWDGLPPRLHDRLYCQTCRKELEDQGEKESEGATGPSTMAGMRAQYIGKLEKVAAEAEIYRKSFHDSLRHSTVSTNRHRLFDALDKMSGNTSSRCPGGPNYSKLCGALAEPNSSYCERCLKNIILTFHRSRPSYCGFFWGENAAALVGNPCKTPNCDRKIGEPNGKAEYNSAYCEKCTKHIIQTYELVNNVDPDSKPPDQKTIDGCIAAIEVAIHGLRGIPAFGEIIKELQKGLDFQNDLAAKKRESGKSKGGRLYG